MMSMKFVIFGAPGAGKGTYSTRLQEKLGIAAISTGDIFREVAKEDTPIGREVKRVMDAGDLQKDDLTIELLRKEISKPKANRGFVLDGYPRTLKQAKNLEKITKIDAVINLVVPEWVIVERLSTRRVCEKCGAIYNVRYLKPKVEGVCDKCGGKLIQRDDDKPDVIKDRLHIYEETTKPLLEFFKNKKIEIVNIECNDVDIPPEIMVDKILKELKEKKLI